MEKQKQHTLKLASNHNNDIQQVFTETPNAIHQTPSHSNHVPSLDLVNKIKLKDQQIIELEQEIHRLGDRYAEEGQNMAEELAKRVTEIKHLQQQIKETNREVREKNLLVQQLETKLEVLTERVENDAARHAEQEARIVQLSTLPSITSPMTHNSDGNQRLDGVGNFNIEQYISERTQMKAIIEKLESDLAIEREQNQRGIHSANVIPTMFSSKIMSTAQRFARSANTSSADLLEELDKMERRYDMQRFLNAQLLIRMQALQGNIQVCCRIRPQIPIERNSPTIIEQLGETEVGYYEWKTKTWKSFGFDRVWGPSHTQEEVFHEVEPLALSVVEGYNGCIFAYGQTGSGKTFTMFGNGDLGPYGLGISFRTLNKIFELLNLKVRQMETQRLGLSRNSDHTPKRLLVQESEEYKTNDENPNIEQKEDENKFSFKIKVAMLEIYNEEIRDLLNARGLTSGGLEIRRETNESLAQIPGLTFEEVSSVEDVVHIFSKGTKNRATTSTFMNEHSSRSHSILIVDVETSIDGNQKTSGRLYLVDLAGSERVNKSGAEGQTLKEAQFINKSLAALGDVMEALDQKATHVPFRNSKLTHLLQDALGGQSRTMMVVTVSPIAESADESYFTLQFATRVRRISINPTKRSTNTKNLEEKMKSLRHDLQRALVEKEKTEKELKDFKQDLTQSRQKTVLLLEARVRTVDELKKGMEAQIEMLKKTNQDMLDKLRHERELRDKAFEDNRELLAQLKILERKKNNNEQEKLELHDQLEKMNKEATLLKRHLQKIKQTQRENSTRQRSLSTANTHGNEFVHDSYNSQHRSQQFEEKKSVYRREGNTQLGDRYAETIQQRQIKASYITPPPHDRSIRPQIPTSQNQILEENSRVTIPTSREKTKKTTSTTKHDIWL